jgi:hypothetical protein
VETWKIKKSICNKKTGAGRALFQVQVRAPQCCGSGSRIGWLSLLDPGYITTGTGTLLLP